MRIRDYIILFSSVTIIAISVQLFFDYFLI